MRNSRKRKETGKSLKQMWDSGRAADLIFLVLLSVYAFYVNRDIVIKGLYMDDLYMWSTYGEQSLLEFAFPIGTSTRFRPVYWLATYLQMAIVGNHISWFVPFNIICNIFVAASIYYMAVKISRYRFPAFLSGICYLVSRFAYYQIGQALGLMETMALGMALWILYLMYRYLNAPHEKTEAELLEEGNAIRAAEQLARRKEKDRGLLASLFGGEKEPSGGAAKRPLQIHLKKSGDWRFALSLLLYFLLAFTHERYIALLPVFYLALICRMLREEKHYRRAFLRENRRWLIAPAVLFALIFVIRALCIGSAIPAGTGGTEVTDTFRLGEALSYAISQVLYIFGVNAGPEHLNGLPWEQTPALIRALTKVSILALLFICAVFALTLLLDLFSREQEGRRRFFRSIQNVLLFLLFIAMCIGCSSVTIRVEMRWIYVSYAAALLFCTYMIGVIGDKRRTPPAVTGIVCVVFLAYSLLSVSCNVFYRQYFPRLYFWPDQLRMNSLAEETWEKYGKDLFGRDIYILGNSYGMSDFYKDTFFKTFDRNKKAEGTHVYFADTAADIPKSELRPGKILVIEEVPAENAYKDITDEVIAEYGTAR